jgi:hypothetical protein
MDAGVFIFHLRIRPLTDSSEWSIRKKEAKVENSMKSSRLIFINKILSQKRKRKVMHLIVMMQP